MSMADEIAGALQELEGSLSSETQLLILPSGAQIPCVPAMEEVGTQIEIGPALLTISHAVRVRKTWFVTTSNTVITVDSDVILADNVTPRSRPGGAGYRTSGFRGETYRVLTVAEDPTGAFFYIRFGSAK